MPEITYEANRSHPEFVNSPTVWNSDQNILILGYDSNSNNKAFIVLVQRGYTDWQLNVFLSIVVNPMLASLIK